MKNKIKELSAMHSIAPQIRRICAIAIAAIIGFSFTALSLTGCDTSNDTTHSHQYGAWKSNAAQHWKECNCGEEYGRANHNGNPCPVCKYNDSSHSHSYSDTWAKDATQHWKECSCGDKKLIANHSGNPCGECGYSSSGDNIFISIADFKTWLDAQSANNEGTAYNITLNVNNLGGNVLTSGSAGNVLYTNSTKYVSLNLSGCDITSIGQSAFILCTNLISITLPNNTNFTSIGESAFSGCTNLISITFPNNINFTSIGMNAFSSCSGLTSVNIPNSVTSLNTGAFSYCTNLASVTLPNNSSYTEIESYVFRNCTSLVNITIPNSITMISVNAFDSCTSLSAITIPSSVSMINYDAFSGCTNLTA